MGARGRGWAAIGVGLKGSVEVGSPVALAIDYGQRVRARRQAQIGAVYRPCQIIRPASINDVGAVVHEPRGLPGEVIGSDLRDYAVITCDSQ